ncbi:MAG TPA: Flp pilus assembly protein CpaB [Blastocatellia bacterium]|nr:Flp pilus assembly protein CpaB [Blastocatellia bacterium]
MNKRFLMALGGAAFFGLMAIMVAQAYMNKKLDDRLKDANVRVFFARVDIPAGSTIQESQIEEGDYPGNRAQEVMKDRKAIIGKTAAYDIAARAPIFSRYLSPAGGGPLAVKVREGYRAFSVPVNESSSVAGFVTPGSFVDVISVMQPAGASRPVARTILQNVKVLASGNQLQTSAEGADNAPRAQSFSTVTLEVPPDQAQMLALALREGSLQLVIRNPNDRNEASVQPASLTTIFGSLPPEMRAAAASPANIPRPTPTIPPLVIATSRALPTPTATPAPTPTPFTVQIFKPGKPPEKYQFPENSGKQTPPSGQN